MSLPHAGGKAPFALILLEKYIKQIERFTEKKKENRICSFGKMQIKKLEESTAL